MEFWPEGSYYCLTCDGNHTGSCFASLTPKREIVVSTDDEGSCYRYVVFRRADVEAECERGGESIADLSAYELTGFYRSYSGPGRGFSDEPRVRVGKRNVVVTQRCGLDI